MSAIVAILLYCAASLLCPGPQAEKAFQVFNYFSPPKPPTLEIIEIGRDMYMARGEWGANVGFFVGDDGVFVIDAKATDGATKKVIKEIQKITKKPIIKVAFTHSDSDCFNGYEAYPSAAEVICSSKSRRELAAGQWTFLEMNAPSSLYSDGPTSAPLSDFFPAVSFSGQMIIRFGSETIELFQCGAAHTSGDVIVSFPARGVAFIGDLVFVHHEPLVQYYKGGYSFGLVTALSILLNSKPEIQTFIPGHADPIGRDELRAIVRSIEETQAQVLAMVDAGKTLEDVKKAFHVSETPQGAGNWVWPSLAVTAFSEAMGKRTWDKTLIVKEKY